MRYVLRKVKFKIQFSSKVSLHPSLGEENVKKVILFFGKFIDRAKGEGEKTSQKKVILQICTKVCQC